MYNIFIVLFVSEFSFLPPIKIKTFEGMKHLFYPDPKRKTLMEGKTFVTFSKSQVGSVN